MGSAIGTLLATVSSVKKLDAIGRWPPRPTLQRILLVEDDASLRAFYSDALRNTGYSVEVAEDGAVGWDVLQQAVRARKNFDLVITDNNMPKLSGIGLINKIRAHGLDLQIILASGTVPENVQGLQLAAVLPKPFSMDQLVQTVAEVACFPEWDRSQWR